MELMRKRLLPQVWSDFLAVFVLSVFIPIFYWFEVFIVLPQHYQENDFLYKTHCVFATFLLMNVVGNFVYLYLTDTSIQGRMLPSDFRPAWKFCEICECVTPPRSWHCAICKTCILKRDHHCTFSACCIGHNNQRYFLMFLFYFTISGAYCTYFNTIFLWKFSSFSWAGLIKLVFPLAIFLFGTDMSTVQIYRVLCITTIIGTLTVGAIFVYHLQNAFKGIVMHERANRIKEYQLPTVKENLIQAFGQRWHLTWISPLIASPLPHDGIDWNQIKKSTAKSK